MSSIRKTFHSICHLPTKFLQPPNHLICITSSPFCLPVAPVLQRWSLSLVRPRHPPYGSQTVPFSMLHLVSGTSSRLLSDNLAPTTLTPTHLFLHPPPHFPPSTHHSDHPSLLRFFTAGSKPTCSTNPFHPRLRFPPSGLTPRFMARHCFF